MWAADLAAGCTIVAADVLDPYVLLQLSDGTAALLAADPASCQMARLDSSSEAAAAAAAVEALRPAAQQDRITACSLYSDTCSWLQQHLAPAAVDNSSSSAYCLVCRTSGACQVYSLPSWQPVFSSSLSDAPAVLADGGSTAADAGSEPAVVLEARLISFGPVAAGRTDPAAARASGAPGCEPPLLLAITADHQLLVYKAFSAGGSGGGGNDRLCFRRLQLDLPPLLPPAGSADQQQQQQAWRLQRLHCFEGLGEDAPYSGVFVAGGLGWGAVAGWLGGWSMLYQCGRLGP